MTTNPEPDAATLAALIRIGLVAPGESLRLTALAGGVSSDIHLAEVGERRFCVKRALPRLKVAAVWEAPISRNTAEASWLRTVGGWLPNHVPGVLGEDQEAGLFAMSYLAPQDHPVWKTQLLAGEIDVVFASAVGDTLGEMHRHSAGDPSVRHAFANDATFEAIRLEPYLRATARVHPDLADTLNALADSTLVHKNALMHGDVSPKNILCGPQGPVFLDAECACAGDPAFDLAFCLNHLLLKAAHRPELGPAYLEAFRAVAAAYLQRVEWEPSPTLERRCARLLPALLLARIDGKSPVEYLEGKAVREDVRRVARTLLTQPLDTLHGIAQFWETG